MMVTPLPGTSSRDLLRALSVAVNEGQVAKNSPGMTPADLRVAFLKWFNTSRDRLRRSISASDLEAVLPSATGWRVANSPGGQGEQIYGLITSEFAVALDSVTAAHESLRATVERLGHRPGVLVVLDTSVLICHRDKLAELVIADDLGERDAPALRMVFPMAVVDELDRLKESKDKDVRWRAGHALGKLDELLGQNHGDGTGPAKINNGRPAVPGGSPLPAPPAYVEVWHDPRGHVRLPIEDDEIIDRALALRDVAQATNRLRLVTFDTSQHMRARAVSLDVVKLERNEHRDTNRCEVCGRG